jgi:hypothetical protein
MDTQVQSSGEPQATASPTLTKVDEQWLDVHLKRIRTLITDEAIRIAKGLKKVNASYRLFCYTKLRFVITVCSSRGSRFSG